MDRLLSNIDKWGKEQKTLDLEIANAILAVTKPFAVRVAKQNTLKANIEKEVFEKNTPLEIPGVAKCIITGRGSYNWKAIALAVRAPEEVIEKHTTIDWKGVADEVGYPKDVERKHYSEPLQKHAELKLLK